MPQPIEHMGVRFPHDPAIITPQIEKVLRNGRYEAQEARAIKRFAQPDDRVVELGGGLGFVSSFLYLTLGIRSIVCVEANPGLCGYIKSVHRENDAEGIDVRNLVAIGDGENAESLAFYRRDPFWSSSLDGALPYEDSVDVPTYPLSRLIQEQEANTVIADIEGGERDLFEDVDLSGVRKILLEVHTRKIGLGGVKACFDTLSSHGFAYDQRSSAGGSVTFRRVPPRQMRRRRQ